MREDRPAVSLAAICSSHLGVDTGDPAVVRGVVAIKATMAMVASLDLLRQRRQQLARALKAATALSEALEELGSGRVDPSTGLSASLLGGLDALGARARRITHKQSVADLVEDLQTEAASLSIRGRPRNHAAHLVAEVAAEMYLATTGRMPAYRTGEPGPYARLVEALFAALGMSVDTRRPAEAAINSVAAGEMRLLARAAEMIRFQEELPRMLLRINQRRQAKMAREKSCI